MVVFVVKRYAVREAKTWRYAVRNAKIERYAVRKGGGGVTLLHETIDYINNFNEKGLLFCSDFNKAFDSLGHNFMRKCLLKFKFPNYIINWIAIFIMMQNRVYIIYCHLSSFFKIEKGVRQGCALSPYLFIICIELLSNEVSLNKDINGIKLGNIEIKQALFADDACFITDGQRKSFQTLVTTIENFSNISGLKLNKDKCTIFKLGSLRNTEVFFYKNKHLIGHLIKLPRSVLPLLIIVTKCLMKI